MSEPVDVHNDVRYVVHSVVSTSVRDFVEGHVYCPVFLPVDTRVYWPVSDALNEELDP
jgi:hypothetical protein